MFFLAARRLPCMRSLEWPDWRAPSLEDEALKLVSFLTHVAKGRRLPDRSGCGSREGIVSTGGQSVSRSGCGVASVRAHRMSRIGVSVDSGRRLTVGSGDGLRGRHGAGGHASAVCGVYLGVARRDGRSDVPAYLEEGRSCSGRWVLAQDGVTCPRAGWSKVEAGAVNPSGISYTSHKRPAGRGFDGKSGTVKTLLSGEFG